MGLRVELIEDLEGIHACERLQKEVWGFSDLSIIPHHVVLTSIHAGGLLLGAYDDEKFIGFALSFPGFFYQNESERDSVRDSEQNSYIVKHCSLMAAVLPEYQSRGIGHQLKLNQRDYVLDQGVELITWTFDPLQSLNAHFNFNKLGVISREYATDLYGDMRDQLNKGLPTDRFLVEWWVDSPRVTHRASASRSRLERLRRTARQINQTDLSGRFLINTQISNDLEDPVLLIEVPESLVSLKAHSQDLAMAWRMETREMLQEYMSRGYLVTDLLVEKCESGRRIYYVIENRALDEVLNRTDED